MTTLKENLIKIGFKADETDTILEKMPEADQQNYADFSMPELALKAGNFRNQYLKKSTVLKNKFTIPGAPEEDTATMVFKRSSFPDAAIDANSATSSDKPKLDMNASGIVSPSSNLQKPGAAINLQKPGGTLLDSNIAPAKPSSNLKKPGSNLSKPNSNNSLPNEDDVDMGIPTMSFKRNSLPGAAQEVNHSKNLTKTPGSSLSSLNNTNASNSQPAEKAEFKLKGVTLKKPSDNKAESDPIAGMDLNTMTMSKSAILGNAIDISSDKGNKKPGSSLSMAGSTTVSENDLDTKVDLEDKTPEVVPPKLKPKLALKGNKGMITPPGSGLELPKPGSSSKTPGLTSPGSGLTSPGALSSKDEVPSGLQAPSGGLKPPSGLQVPTGGLRVPGSLTPPPPPPPGDLATPAGGLAPPPPGELSLKQGTEVHSPGDLSEAHDKKLSLNSPSEDSNETVHEDVKETVTTSLNKLKKNKPSKKGKKPLLIMVTIGVLLLAGIAFLVTSLLGDSDEDIVAKENIPKKVAPVKKKAPVKVEEIFKSFANPESREWAYRTASPLKFDLKNTLVDTWTFELWFNLPEQNTADNLRLIQLKSQDEIILMLKLNPNNFCTVKAGEENFKADKAFRSGKTQYHLAISCENKIASVFINGRYISKLNIDKVFNEITIGNDKLAIVFDELRVSAPALYMSEENFIPSRTLERNEESLLYIPFEATKDSSQLNVFYPKEQSNIMVDSNAWINMKQPVLDISALLSELENEVIDDELPDLDTVVR